MIPVVTDIDIDVPDRERVLQLFRHVSASNFKDGKKGGHNTGVYFHTVPTDPFTNRCVLDYEEAEQLGYFKIDVLNVGIYKDVRDPSHMDELLEREPVWELLKEQDFCDMVFHMRGHHNLCKQMQPQNVSQLAAVLAMIRPAKRHLIGKPWDKVMSEVWIKPGDEQYYFKKSHATSYAMAVKLHMNLLVEQLTNTNE
jgi:hypothetical protein